MLAMIALVLFGMSSIHLGDLMDRPEQMEDRPKRQKLEPQSAKAGVQEKDVGILSYISDDLPGFSGILKARYADFQVNEISKKNEVVVLRDFGAELEKPAEKPEQKVQEKPQTPDISKFEAALHEKLGAELVQQVHNLFSTGTRVESQAAFTDKQERTEIHRLCAEAWSNRLETETLPDGRLTFRLKTRHSRKPRDTAKAQGAFLKFAVYKENKETMEVASTIAKLLRIPNKQIAFAGTKDRRAVTTQLFSVRHMNASRVSSVNHALKGIRLGNFHYGPQPLRLGDLAGNRFYIALRDVKNLENVDEALQSLETKGFINYYGLQRFGTFSVSTHTIGRCILSGDYQGAVDGILGPQQLSSGDDAEARAAYAAGDLQRALELFPRRANAERALLTALQDSPSPLNAILRIPRNLKLMYVHAYQSYIWNSVASERMKLGFEVLVGDLVLCDSGAADDEFQRARPVTQAEIDGKEKTIYDVVLPTPGFDVEYPANEVQVYEQLMSADSIDCHKMRRNVREFSLSGAYRLLLARPRDVKWWKVKYNEEHDPLVRTDAELVQENTEEKLVRYVGGTIDGLVLEMSLGPSQYATMALREVMKTETSRRGELFFGPFGGEAASSSVPAAAESATASAVVP